MKKGNMRITEILRCAQYDYSPRIQKPGSLIGEYLRKGAGKSPGVIT
jgi:hypothetical protein